MNVHKNKDLLKKIREEKKLQNELKEESIICFFEYDPKTHNYIVRDLGARRESKSKEEINGVENKIKVNCKITDTNIFFIEGIFKKHVLTKIII